MIKTSRTAFHGIRIYGKWLLAVYDLLIMKLLSPYVWRCHERHFVTLYQRLMSRNHADIGVGTGYCLARCRYQPHEARIALIDYQSNCLEHCARRLARFEPECYRRNALEPIHIDADGFDSIALGGVLHCMPGDMRSKGRVFDALSPISNRHTRVFGYSIVNRGIRKTLLSRSVYFVLQRLKVINGLDDSPAQLLRELQARYRRCEVKVIGCVAIFTAEHPIGFAH